jgi:hypothetical protein
MAVRLPGQYENAVDIVFFYKHMDDMEKAKIN